MGTDQSDLLCNGFIVSTNSRLQTRQTCVIWSGQACAIVSGQQYHILWYQDYTGMVLKDCICIGVGKCVILGMGDYPSVWVHVLTGVKVCGIVHIMCEVLVLVRYTGV